MKIDNFISKIIRLNIEDVEETAEGIKGKE